MSRRPPPPFLHAVVTGREWLTHRLARVTVEGAGLTGFVVSQPASSVRVLIPGAAEDRLELPGWDGNRFVLSDGTRPVLRTLTPHHVDSEEGRLQLDVVVHGEGAASSWAAHCEPGSPVALSGPARGHVLDGDTRELIVGGDETAFAAIRQIIEAAPGGAQVTAFFETPGEESRPAIPEKHGLSMRWVDQQAGEPCRALVDAMSAAQMPDSTRLWAAGEAAAMQTLRKHLFTERGMPRDRATIRGYWKHGRNAGEAGDNL